MNFLIFMAMKSTIEKKVRGYHIDYYGHVNNTRFLEFLEDARWDFKEKFLNITDLHKANIGFITVNINVNFLSPATLGETLEISTSIKEIGNTSIKLEQDIHSKSGKHILEAIITQVLFDFSRGKPVPIKKYLNVKNSGGKR
ncbi:MAG: thioesterase [Candidatus Neomarinimicrobiota bacterium]|nr:MAG: thioesterase [Candidatus Neomarinimicrobiota bacterium]